MVNRKPGLYALISLFALLAGACSKDEVSPEPEKTGSIAFSLKVSGGSPQFKSLARSASLKISAPDMQEMVQALTLTDTSVEGAVEAVPAGPSRKFEISVLDSLHKEVYAGSAIADVKANASNSVSMVVKRVAGTVTVDGTIVEGTDSGSLSQRTLKAGAQSSSQYGSFLDIDEFKTYLAAGARAQPAEIDLLFLFSASTNATAIYAPYTAKNGINGSAGFDLMSGFDPANQTELKTVSAEFPGVTAQRQLDSLWALGTPVTGGRLLLSNGITFMAKSNRGSLVLLQVASLEPGATGSGDLLAKAMF